MANYNGQDSKEVKGDNKLVLLWNKFTNPQPELKDEYRKRYMTNILLAILSLVSIPFTILAFMGWFFKITPLDTAMIGLGMTFLFIFAWFLVRKGFTRMGGCIPSLIMFFSAVYGNYVGGIDAPAMVLYALAIVLAAILLDTPTQMVFLALSLVSYFSLGLAHFNGLLPPQRASNEMFVNRISIFFVTITTISLGIWFLKNQYSRLLNQANIQADNMRAIFKTVTDGIILTDLKGKIINLNDAIVRMFEMKNKEKELGSYGHSFISPEDLPRVKTYFYSLQAGNYQGLLSCRGVGLKGTLIDLEINAALFYDTDGQPAGFVTAIRDITERKKAELELLRYRDHLEDLVEERTAELKEAYDELESFSYSISHDLRSPLRRIEGFSKILNEDFSNSLNEQGVNYLKRITLGTQHMGELINDLLAFSRLIRQPVTRKTVDPATIAREVVEELLSSEYAGKPVDIRVEEMPISQADPALLHQVYFNLIDNAIKYSLRKENPTITIGSQKDDRQQTVYFVSDNGIGFDMQYADRLFGVFQRLHSNAEYEGTGIGLAIVQRIIRRHNGKIWMESEIDHGTRFYFTLQNDTMDNEPVLN